MIALYSSVYQGHRDRRGNSTAGCSNRQLHHGIRRRQEPEKFAKWVFWEMVSNGTTSQKKQGKRRTSRKRIFIFCCRWQRDGKKQLIEIDWLSTRNIWKFKTIFSVVKAIRVWKQQTSFTKVLWLVTWGGGWRTLGTWSGRYERIKPIRRWSSGNDTYKQNMEDHRWQK